jgi:CspA family cold shock protein
LFVSLSAHLGRGCSALASVIEIPPEGGRVGLSRIGGKSAPATGIDRGLVGTTARRIRWRIILVWLVGMRGSSAMRLGRILRFDDVRGYGFIVQEGDGDDVFVHANELCDDKSLFAPGTPVEFEVTESSRGLKAFAVHVSNKEPEVSAAEPARAPNVALDDDGMCDVLSTAEFKLEFTELMLEAGPELTAVQIVRLRTELLASAKKHGWVEG